MFLSCFNTDVWVTLSDPQFIHHGFYRSNDTLIMRFAFVCVMISMSINHTKEQTSDPANPE